MPESASAAEQSRSEMIMPSHAHVSPGAMLRLDDEMAGLIEAADMAADQAGAHPTKPEPASPVAGEVSSAHNKSAAAAHIGYVLWCSTAGLLLCCALLCCAALRCAVLCCAVLCCAVLCCAVLCFPVLCVALLCSAVLGCLVPVSLRCAAAW